MVLLASVPSTPSNPPQPRSPLVTEDQRASASETVSSEGKHTHTTQTSLSKDPHLVNSQRLREAGFPSSQTRLQWSVIYRGRRATGATRSPSNSCRCGIKTPIPLRTEFRRKQRDLNGHQTMPYQTKPKDKTLRNGRTGGYSRVRNTFLNKQKQAVLSRIDLKNNPPKLSNVSSPTAPMCGVHRKHF